MASAAAQTYFTMRAKQYSIVTTLFRYNGIG